MAARRAWLPILVGLVASPFAAAAEDNGAAPAPMELAAPDGEAPRADFLCAAAAPGLLVRLRDLSEHNDGRILLWEWDFGDGTGFAAQTRSANPTEHAYAKPGTYTVVLTVYDEHGVPSQSVRSCTALPAAPVGLVLPPLRSAQAAVESPDGQAAAQQVQAAAGTATDVPAGADDVAEDDGTGAAMAAEVADEVMPDVTAETTSDATLDAVAAAAKDTVQTAVGAAGGAVEGAVDAVEGTLDVTIGGLPPVHLTGCVDLLSSCRGAGADDAAVPEPHVAPAPDASAPEARATVGTGPLAVPEGGQADPAVPGTSPVAGSTGGGAMRPVADVAVPVGAGGAASAVAGLTAVAVAGFLAVGPWRRLLRGLVLTPLGTLFTRIKGEELLDHPLRTEIVQAVEAEPGIHYQALVRAVGKGNGVLEHHLRMLTAGGLLKERAANGYTCYFPAATDRRMMDVHAVLKSSVARRVLDICMERPGNAIGELAKSVGVTPKAVTYHLNRFEDVGLVRTERSGRSVLVYANPLALHAAPAAVSSAA